jgi:hypothetical protein
LIVALEVELALALQQHEGMQEAEPLIVVVLVEVVVPTTRLYE